MLITKVSAQRRPGRYNIFLDGKYAFSASEKTVAEFVLLKGKELNDQQVEEIRQFDADAKASDLAAHFLSYEPRTVFEVLQYLKKHEISDEAANSAVSQLNELGYLDDQQYVKLFIKNDLQVGSDGPKSLLRKLTQKGVDPELSQNTLDEVDENDWLNVGQRVIKSMIHQAGKLSQRELGRKMKTKLLMHGFDSGISSVIISALDLAEDEDLQIEALKKQGIKAYKRFRRFDERERNFKIKKYLFSHGFSSSEIDAFLNGEIIDLAELAEY
ncbi:recombination regulator RecX [Lactobacillus kefiranofaciens]|uniref:Regulatory protein RecX n=1 Tax=Lactobacillus kefiranofaciens TaxID=267818 RepID=A0AAX3UEQ6_9LACO|nr:recombination regulator RecX [Lactobacillus kefiranofaciens]AEG40710.1 Regulatory protein recX [Lactobacillus kefiranofaciens subsp. kefiranofaciens]KRM22743.1 regulatory protein recX [Lactobacillus kefiranofaciens subsp. kefiranofaciens DSM 5016 = JCM 6985]MDF4142434.1 recombination regulator RecX [Lactobacillus kefiranofaciens]QFQ68226.1 recombination regulator RecX [Lactobacillus kefiranofaciens subsp. kefiranofaciens]QNT43690.1 recombination regulator RecX [Lactobacillus kefiranofaciens